MQETRTTLLASGIVVGTGALWGLYWLPVRRLAAAGLPGGWGTLAALLVALLALAPVAVVRRRRLAAAEPMALASVALGGAAFMLYSVGLVYGRVAVIILLFYLTPVWSTLIGRYVMGWPHRRGRTLAILTGLAGLGLMLGADGEIPVPRGTGEWLALASGFLWAISSTGIRSRSELAPAEAGLVFVAGGCAGALVLAPLLGAWPSGTSPGDIGAVLGWLLGAGLFWWALSMIGLMWATARLEPARVGILLMSEVLVGALSAALFAGERLGPPELAGGALVLLAGVMEVWPGRRA